MLLFTLHTFAIDEPHGRMQGWCHPTVWISKTKRQLHTVRWTSTMYRVHLDSGANQGEIPGIGESPSNQPISGLVIFSKRQALSRAVVVNSNMSRGKYLAREGPGSRLGDSASRGTPDFGVFSMQGDMCVPWRDYASYFCVYCYAHALIFVDRPNNEQEAKLHECAFRCLAWNCTTKCTCLCAPPPS